MGWRTAKYLTRDTAISELVRFICLSTDEKLQELMREVNDFHNHYIVSPERLEEIEREDENINIKW